MRQSQSWTPLQVISFNEESATLLSLEKEKDTLIAQITEIEQENQYILSLNQVLIDKLKKLSEGSLYYNPDIATSKQKKQAIRSKVLKSSSTSTRQYQQ